MERNIPSVRGGVVPLYELQDLHGGDKPTLSLPGELQVGHELEEKCWSSSLSDRGVGRVVRAILHCRSALGGKEREGGRVGCWMKGDGIALHRHAGRG